MSQIPLKAAITPLRDDGTFADICESCRKNASMEEFTIGRLGGWLRCNVCHRVWPSESCAMVSLDELKTESEKLDAGSH